MKLFSITTSYPRFEGDDSSIFVKRLCLALGKQVQSLEVFVPHDGPQTLSESQEEVTVHRVRFWPIPTALTFGAGLLENIKQKPARALLLPALIGTLAFQVIKRRANVDVMHANWIVSGAAALIAKVCTGRPYVLTLRGSEMMLIRSPWVRALYWPVLKGASFVTTVSESMRLDLVNFFPSLAPRTRFIPNGIASFEVNEQTAQDFKVRHKLSASVPYFLSVGSVIPRKRIEKLLELMAHPAMHSAHLLLCGKVEHREYHQQLETLVSRFGLVDRVHFLGAVTPNDIGNALHISKVLLTASSFEGKPNAVLEAMSAGVPVVASDIDAHREIIQTDVNGLLVDFSDINQIAERVLKLIGDRAKRDELIAAAKRSVADQSWEGCAKQYMRHFSEIQAGAKV